VILPFSLPSPRPPFPTILHLLLPPRPPPLFIPLFISSPQSCSSLLCFTTLLSLPLFLPLLPSFLPPSYLSLPPFTFFSPPLLPPLILPLFPFLPLFLPLVLSPSPVQPVRQEI